MKIYKVKLIPLTSIHIGTGREFGPFEYTIIDGMYCRFSIEKIIQSKTGEDRQKLLEAIDKMDIKQLAQLFGSYANEESILYKIPASENFREKFKEKLKDPNNQLLVSETYRSPEDYLPVIPGSSIKGAIRTAIVSKYGENKKKEELFEKDRNGRNRPKNDFESIILECKDAKNDPFRAIHISDCKIRGENSQFVSEKVNFKINRRNGCDFASMQMIQEQIRGILIGGNAYGEFELSIDDKLQERNLFKFNFSLEDILSTCNRFYKNHMAEESKKFYKDYNHQKIKEMRIKLLSRAKNIVSENKECLIRIGRHSQIENVTIDIHRLKEGNSRMLNEFYFPLGWAILKVES